MKFKVGDRVRVIRQFAYNTYIIGKIGTIRIIANNGEIGIEFDEYIHGHDLHVLGKCKYGYGWYCPDDILEPVHDNSKIVITTDGKTTTAKMYDGKKFIKSAKAVCSPDDEFNFERGAGIAISRLFEWEFVPDDEVKETLLNTKICIIEGDEHLKTGHIYEIVDGEFQCDVIGNGTSSTFPIGFRFRSIDEVEMYLSHKHNSNCSHFSTTPIKFIEVVE